MKRSAMPSIDDTEEPSNKVFLVELRGTDGNLTKLKGGKISSQYAMAGLNNLELGFEELANDHIYHDSSRVNPNMKQFLTLNKVDFIGRQMENLQNMMLEPFENSALCIELNGAACNFVKRPGHIYHLYERSSGQKYFSLLSPEEWENAPHKYVGSWRLEADYSWTVPLKGVL